LFINSLFSLYLYEKIQGGDKRLFDGYFKHEGRYIWHYAIALDAKKTLTVFLDEELRSREQKDYLDRIDGKVSDYSLQAFHDKQYRLGAIAIIENTGKKPYEIFAAYKICGDVEVMIDALKNIVDADRTYMQNEQALPLRASARGLPSSSSLIPNSSLLIPNSSSAPSVPR